MRKRVNGEIQRCIHSKKKRYTESLSAVYISVKQTEATIAFSVYWFIDNKIKSVFVCGVVSYIPYHTHQPQQRPQVKS